ncbi:MAG: hypothetical protein ABIS30_03370 [Gallionella sp.]|jgi:hypothetical protein
MKYWIVLFSLLLSAQALASPTSVIPLNQNLAVVDYFGEGRQTGCGVRATGETKDNLWLNVLITVFLKETGSTFGVIKVVARKVKTKDGVPLLKDGKITYTNLGKIQKAWIKSDSGKEPLIYKNDEASHSGAYMVSAEFASTVDLLAEMIQGNFRVGLNRNAQDLDEVFQFNKPLDKSEGEKLSVCMKNLRDEMEEKKDKQNF